jgi:mono/diheme cytochrome c family protein
MDPSVSLPSLQIARLAKQKSIGTVFTLYSCLISGGLLSATAAEKVTYDDHVRPIFADRCLTCHNPDKAKGGLDLTTYSTMMEGGSSGEIVNSGEPGNSRLFRSVTHAEEPFMPPKAEKLTTQRLNLIRDWITGGLLENSGSKAKASKPAFNMELAKSPAGKPEGPPPMPAHLILAPEVTSSRAATPSDITSSPWAPLIALAVPRQVLLYNSNTLHLEGVLPFPEGTPATLAFSRNGTILIAGGGRGGKSGLVVGWEVKSGNRVFAIGAEYDTVLAADITADHKLVALGGPGRRIKIYSTKDGEEVINIKKHTDWVTAIAFSPDGILLATGDRNGGLFVWESGTGNLFYTLKAHSKSITAISWRVDSNLVASASEDGSVRLWEMNEGKQVKNWTGHGGGITDMAYTADGRIATCGRDRQAKVWDGNGGQKSTTKDFADIPVTVCLNHDGSRLIAADWVGNVRVVNSSDGKPIGTLLANPPSIDTRFARAAETLLGKEKTLEQTKKIHSEKLIAVSASTKNLETTRAQLAAARKRQENTNAALQGAKALLAQHKEAHDVTASQLNTSTQAVVKLEADFKTSPPEDEKRKQLETALNEAKVLLDQQQKDLTAKRAMSKESSSAVASTQEGLDSAVAALAAAAAQVKASETDHQAKVKAEAKAREPMLTAEQDLASASANKRRWQAANINLDRYKKASLRPMLEEKLEHLQLSQTQSRQTHELHANTAAAAATSLANTQKEELQSVAALNTARDRLPDLKWELRLAEVIASQQRGVAETIQTAMKEAPDTLKPKIQAAVEDAGKALATTDSQLTQTRDLLDHSVERAQSALDELRSRVVGAQKDLATRQSEEAAALLVLGKAEKAHKEGTAKIEQLDREISDLFKLYLETLPARPVEDSKK